MHRISLAALAAMALVLPACASSSASVSPRVLAAADPSAAASSYSPPANPLEDRRPRTLDLDIADPAHMHPPEKAPEIGTPNDRGEDHSQHGSPSPTPTPKPVPTKKPSPGATEQTMYVCPMHPEVRDTQPSTCPKCGMKLEPVKDPKPSATPSPKPSATPTATPSGHEHHHGTAP